jgi:hypothetical protein
VAWVIAAALLGAARPAHTQPEGASTYRAVIDRADLEPAAVGGYRLRVYVSALDLDGKRLELEPNVFKLYTGKSEVRAPYAIGSFAATQTDLAMVLVIQATAEYADLMRAPPGSRSATRSACALASRNTSVRCRSSCSCSWPA